MKKQILLLIPSVFLVTACSSTADPTPEPKPCQHVDVNPANHYCDLCGAKVSNHIDSNNDDHCDICGEYMGDPPPVEECEEDDDICRAEKSGSVAECTPKYPFYLKVGEQKNVSVKMKDGQITEEKYFNWENTNPNLELTVNEKDPNKAVVKALTAPSEGYCTFKAINKVATSIVGEYNAKVIDFKEEDEYLWQCGDKVDRTPFGYDSKEAKAGVKSGNATLGDKVWAFERSEVRALNSANGAIVFGKGKAPENVTLKTTNDRKIESITIETGSANYVGKLSVKVGEKECGTQTCPKPKNSKLSYLTFDCEDAEGDITLSFVTPEFDPSREGDEDYYTPGATYLKSIHIKYAEIEAVAIEVSEESKHQNVFTSWDKFTTEGLVINKVTESGAKYPLPISALKIENPDLSENPSKATVKISYTQYENVFETSYDVYKATSISLKEGTKAEVTKYVEYANFNPLGLVVLVNTEDPEISFDYSSKIKWCQASKYNETKGTATNLYLEKDASKVVGFVDGTPELGKIEVDITPVYEISELELQNDPNTKTYLESAKFSYAGMKVAGFAEDKDVEPSYVQDKLKYYDGASYEANPENPELWSETLSEGTIKVYGVLTGRSSNPIIIDEISVAPIDHFDSTGTLESVEYGVGETFNPKGLTINALSEDESLKLKVANDSFNWYDGPSYEAEPQIKTTSLKDGTTYVVGELKTNENKTIKVSGITVSASACELSLVKSADDIVDGAKYLVVAKTATGFACVDGTLTSAVADNPKAIDGFALEDTVELNKAFANCGFTATLNGDENPTLTLKSDKDVYIGMSNSGLSITKTAAHTEANYAIDDSTFKVTLSYTFIKSDAETTYYFGFNTSTNKFNGTKSGAGEIYLYRFN